MARQYLHRGVSEGSLKMLFSVLLPTYNRLEYLKLAIETVRRQDYPNWEIVVSDNCSVDDIAGYVSSLSDARIKYVRTEAFVPVTENWNNALKQSTGDYVVMLGDDDGLLPGYFSTLLQAFGGFPDPDFVYVGAYFFAYPGVLPDAPDGFLRRDRNLVLTEQEPFWLGRERARAIALGYLQFRMPVASNMQFSLISRRKIIEMTAQGPFFRSPYPDFYATPMLFLNSSKILIYPVPMVVVGITPKSYGFYHFNNRVQDGTRMLNNERSLSQPTPGSAMLLPGAPYYDSWLLAMEAVRASCAEDEKIVPNYRRYRLLQIINVYKRCYFDRTLPPEGLYALRRRMHLREKLVYGLGLELGFKLLRLLPRKRLRGVIGRLRSMIGQHALGDEQADDRRYGNLLDVFQAHDIRGTTR
jgi:glycosyltransferase involved in cell wall biosynthesis